MSSFAGRWQTTFGPMELTQAGGRVHGSYFYMGTECLVEGEASDGRLVFAYQEPTVRGEGWFALKRRGQAFAGQFRPEGSDRWGPWEGERVGFDGLWNTSFGLLRLIEDKGRVHGHYEAGGGATLNGRVKDNQLTFTYQEAKVGGRGRFVLAEDGLSFQGEWQAKWTRQQHPWRGIRVRPQPQLLWLVVIEAPWQRFLSEREYSFGNMLREFFARAAHVQVRHRFFSNEAGLRRCCRDLLYIAEPVVLVLATHARPQGLTVGGQVIGVRTVVDSLRPVENLRLVHFSACSFLQDPTVLKQLRKLSNESGTAVSGYQVSVDWAASAIIEFAYLDLILCRGLPPAAAVGQLERLLPFAGEKGVPEGVFPAAHFHLVTPDTGESVPPREPRVVV
jgi:hypothetical protein